MTADDTSPSRPEPLAEKRHAQEFFQLRRKVSLFPVACGALACFAGDDSVEGASDFSRVDAWGLPVAGSYLTAAGDCREADTIDTLLKRADAAMYTAKENGRDRIELVTAAAVAWANSTSGE